MDIISAIISFFLVLFGTLTSNIANLGKPQIYSPCVPAIRYQIGTIDERFRISGKKLLEYTTQATNIWKDSLGQEVFVYDPEGTKSASERVVTINMVYDERQKLNSEIKQIEGNVNSQNKQVQASWAEYEQKVKSFNQRSDALSDKIKNLDIHDPEYPQKFDAIIQESQSLNREADELNQLAASLNQTTDSYNTKVNKLKKTISKLNQVLEQKPEEGLYKSDTDTIDIYINSNNYELVHTISHEFGHALGIEHIDNPKSLMYPNTSSLIKATEDDVNAIKEACRERELK